MNSWKQWKYKNLIYLIGSLIVTLILFQYESFHQFLLRLGEFGYVGAFFAGILFVSTFTVATGALILLVLAEFLSPIEIGLIAGLGAMVGDAIIFRFIRDDLTRELRPIYYKLGGGHVTKILHTPYFSWTLPVLGAIIIASPLPDEIGISLMGISKMNTPQFLIVSFILNALGILLVISVSTVIKP